MVEGDGGSEARDSRATARTEQLSSTGREGSRDEHAVSVRHARSRVLPPSRLKVKVIGRTLKACDLDALLSKHARRSLSLYSNPWRNLENVYAMTHDA